MRAHGAAMQPEWVEELGDEELPDVGGLAPVRSLEQLRAPPAAARRRERCEPLAALRKHWGYDAFRPLQAEAVAAAMAKADSLIVLPTGGGKSLCYQVPAACGAGLVLVVSPLIALMDDQVAAAREAGLEAGALHTHVDGREKGRLRDLAAAGALDLLYVSPERLCVGDLMRELAPRLALIAVDEAHCVSHWGHDFRPEYRQLRPILDQAPKVPRMGLTATATPQVQDDICLQLGLRSPRRMVGHVDRPNLVYRSLPRLNGTKQVLEVIKRHPDEGGIVYAQTRKEVERLAESLKKEGVQCAPYHAGLDAAVRAKVQAAFVAERLDVVVATIAFGMGIDRSNVRYVIHANTPKSIEHYQQEAGRAGRDGLPAECVLLASAADLVTHRQLAMKDGPLSPERAKVLERALRDIGRFAVAPICRHRLLTEHFGQPYPPPGTASGSVVRGPSSVVEDSTIRDASSPTTDHGPRTTDQSCGACDVCLGETTELPKEEALLIAQKIISAAWRLNGRYGAGMVVDVLMGKASDKIARAGHDRLSVFGLLKDQPEGSVRAWIDQLAVQGFLAVVEDGMYSFLTMTDAGKALCRGEGQVRLGRFVEGRARKSSTGRVAKAEAASELASADRPLFERLRNLRRQLADQLGVPPYVVFTDVTLRALAAERPTTLDAMRGIKGIGETKLARYGKLFLPVIAGQAAEG